MVRQVGSNIISRRRILIDEPALRKDIQHIKDAKAKLEEADRLIPGAARIDAKRMMGDAFWALGDKLNELKRDNISKNISACGSLASYIDEVIKRYQATDRELASSVDGGQG